jgi:uncharacterized protein
MGAMKTPGVYVVEKSAFPNSVVEVATAVPAFIGYTEKADNGGKSLVNKPWRVTSMLEFQKYFGWGPIPEFDIKEIGADAPSPAEPDGGGDSGDTPAADASANETREADFNLDGKEYYLEQTKGKYYLYYSMMLFFQNGGGPCYIVSAGDYTEDIEADKLKKGITPLIKEQEPTMLVIPDAALLKAADCISLQQAALAHCGGKMMNRVAILDLIDGYKDRQDKAGDCVAKFRNALGINYLDYGIAYYPWLNTTIVQDNDISYYKNVNIKALQDILGIEFKEQRKEDENLDALIENISKPDLNQESLNSQNKALLNISPTYSKIVKSIKEKLNLLPPSAAIAGIYTMVDNLEGVWKAPANVSLSSVISPAVNISNDEQEDLNVTIQGKSINAIRPFIGEGTLVWGARTLDGNSLDWRYVNVRRTMIMLKESIRLATKAYVFDNNDANTWVTIKSMIRNFLTGIWKRGGLAGASPDDAFSVSVGLGETMTPDDILEGILKVTVLVALIRPAEFIEITFQQQMQKS